MVIWIVFLQYECDHRLLCNRDCILSLIKDALENPVLPVQTTDTALQVNEIFVLKHKILIILLQTNTTLHENGASTLFHL